MIELLDSSLEDGMNDSNQSNDNESMNDSATSIEDEVS
jgi:hypothetical protein